MKRKLFFLLLLADGLVSAVAAPLVLPGLWQGKAGLVKGRVADEKNNPIAGAKVVIENTVFYATYVYATTDKDGRYAAKVPNGSWNVSVRIEKSFAGKIYRFDLHPDDASPFAGTAGAVRNFVWKISGPRPEGGFYGSDLAVYNQPGTSLSLEDVVMTLTPVGELINGTKGDIVQKGLTDIGGGEDGVRDVPLGQYKITAAKKDGTTLKIRLRNKGNYADSYTAVFEAGFTGLTHYKIAVQVSEE